MYGIICYAKRSQQNILKGFFDDCHNEQWDFLCELIIVSNKNLLVLPVPRKAPFHREELRPGTETRL